MSFEDYIKINGDKPLSPMQMRFAEEMIIDGSSIAAAARRAGYSIASARECGSRLWANPKIRAIVDEANNKAVKKMGITKERVLQQLWLIATSNPAAAVTYDEDGQPSIDLRSLSQDNAAITEVAISTTTGGKKQKNVTIKTPKQADKVAALIKIGQHLGMFKDQLEVKGTLTLEQLIVQSMDEAETAIDTATPELEYEPELEAPVGNNIKSLTEVT